MKSYICHQSLQPLTAKPNKKVSFQTIDNYYSNNKRSLLSTKGFGLMSIQENKMLMLSQRTPNKNSLSEAKTNHSSSSTKQLLYKKKSFTSSTDRCLFKKGKTISSPFSIVKRIAFDSNEEKIEDKDNKETPIIINIAKESTLKPSLRYSSKIDIKTVDSDYDDDEEDENEENKEEVKEQDNNKKTNLLRSSQPVKSFKHVNTIDNDNKNNAKVKVFKYQIEKFIEEIKDLDQKTFEIDKESNILKKEINDKKEWSDKLTTLYNELKEGNKGIITETILFKKKTEEIKNSIVEIIQKRLKSKIKTKEVTQV